MKNSLLLIALFVAQLTFAQKTKNLGDFDEIKVFDRISVEIILSDENKIEITGDRSNDVEIVNNNGQLKIRMAINKLLNGEMINCKLYAKNVRSIDVSEGSYVESATAFTQRSIELTAKEGGQIKVRGDFKKVDIKAVTGGIVTVSGTSDNQDINVGTGGKVDAKAMITQQTSVKISAGGEVDINATELVNANVKAGGNVNIYGNPREVNEKTMLGGSIKRVN